MKTYTLVCEKRNLALKTKKARKKGFVPAVVYGRHIDSISIQIQQSEVNKLLQIQSVGSKILLIIDGKEQLVVIKHLENDPLSRKILHIEFHALKSGEKVKVTLPINLTNKDSIKQGTYLQEGISELEISTLPKFLMDYVNVDVSKYSLGDSVYVSDLPISNDENFDVLSSSDSLVLSIIHAERISEEPTEEEPAENTSPETSEE